MIVVVVDSFAGTLDRFECAAPKVKLTHRYVHGGACTFQSDVVEEMRLMPPDHLSVEPPPTPPLPPAQTYRVAELLAA